MNPEDLLRELRNPANWNAKPTRRTDAFPARRRMSPWFVSLATIAAVAVVVVLVFSAFGASVRGLRQPAVPPVPSNSVTPTPTPTPTGSPVPVTYTGAATCSNLLDSATVDAYKAKGWVDVSAQYIAQESVDPDWKYRDFVENDGLVCAWGLPGAAAADTVSFAYGPASAREKTKTYKAFTYGSTYLHNVEYVGPGINDRSQGAFAFGGRYWAASFDTGEGQVLDQVVSHAPDFPKRSTQSAVYATSEGIGDIRIGQRLSSSTLVAWNPTACYKKDTGAPWTGAWQAKKPFDDSSNGHRIIDVVTSNGYRNGTVDLIWIESSEIPTKSGIRVGDTVATLKAKFPDIAKTPSLGDADTYELEGSAGIILFFVAYPSFSGDPAAPSPEVVSIAIVPKGGDLPHWGGDSGGSCKA